MAGKTIKRWITIEGNHIPIYEDGSLGGAAEKMGLKNTSDLKSDNKRSQKEDKLRKDGMSEDNIKKYLDNEEKADALERELNEEMSSTGEGKHSVNWREEQQAKISKLRDENQELAYGNKETGQERTKTDIYKEQLADVQDQLDNAPKSKALRDEEAIAELERKKAELESYIEREESGEGLKITKVGDTVIGPAFNPQEMREQLDKEKADKAAAEKALLDKANETFTAPDKDLKRAAQADTLKSLGIDRDAALEAIQKKAEVDADRAEELMDGMSAADIKRLAQWNKTHNKGDTNLSDKKPGDTMTVDYHDLDESPEDFKKRAQEEGFEVLGEGGHSVTLRKQDKKETGQEKEPFEKGSLEGTIFGNNKTKYEPLNDEEREVLNTYLNSPEGKWAKDMVNDQLNNGEDWDKVTRQAYGVASKYVKPSGVRRLQDGTIDRKKMDIPKDMPGYKDLDDYDKEMVDGLFKTETGVAAEFPAMERQIEQVAKSTDKRPTESSLKKNFGAHISNIRDTAYSLDNEEMAAHLNKMADEYEERFNKSIESWKNNTGKGGSANTKSTNDKSIKVRDKELEEAYKKGQVAPEDLRSVGYTDKDLAELSKSGRDEALKRVEEGRNKSTYIDPMGNLNQKKTRSEYEKNYGEDFRGMSKSQARKERIGGVEVSDSARAQFSDKSDDELLNISRNAYKYKFSREESKAINDELKSRGYDYINGGWKKNRQVDKSIKVGDKEIGVSKAKEDNKIAENNKGYYITKDPSGMGDHYSLYYQHPNSGSDGLTFLGDAYGSIDKLESRLGQSIRDNESVQNVLKQARSQGGSDKSIKVGDKNVTVSKTKLSNGNISNMSATQIRDMIKNIRSGESDSQYSIAELQEELRRRKK